MAGACIPIGRNIHLRGGDAFIGKDIGRVDGRRCRNCSISV